jgi:putative transposase
LIWLWVATIELESKEILGISICKERNMLLAERFISSLVRIHGQHPVSTDGGSWYRQACRFLRLPHHIHSSYEKSIIERTMQYIKKIEPNALMTISLAERRIVNNYMCGIG